MSTVASPLARPEFDAVVTALLHAAVAQACAPTAIGSEVHARIVVAAVVAAGAVVDADPGARRSRSAPRAEPGDRQPVVA